MHRLNKIILSMILALSLCACGNDKKQESNKKDEKEEVSEVLNKKEEKDEEKNKEDKKENIEEEKEDSSEQKLDSKKNTQDQKVIADSKPSNNKPSSSTNNASKLELTDVDILILGPKIEPTVDPSVCKHENLTRKVKWELDCLTKNQLIYYCLDCVTRFEDEIDEYGPHATITEYHPKNNETHYYFCDRCWNSISLPHEYVKQGPDLYQCKLCLHIYSEFKPQKVIDEVYKIINVVRTAKGLSALTYNSNAQAIANRRAKEIISDFSHNGFMNLSESEANIIGSGMIGENIAKGDVSVQSILNRWMESEEHKANILNPNYTKISIGVEYLNGITYYAVLFGQ